MSFLYRVLEWLRGGSPGPFYSDVIDDQIRRARTNPVYLFLVDTQQRRLEGLIAGTVEFLEHDRVPYQGGVHLSNLVGPAEMVLDFIDAYDKHQPQHSLVVTLPKTNVSVEIPQPRLSGLGNRVFLGDLILVESLDLLHRQERITHYAHY